MGMSEWVAKLNNIEPAPLSAYIKANTPRWYTARRGRLTASKRAILIAKEIDWPKLLEEVHWEMSREWSRIELDVPAVRWGTENEAPALADLEFTLGCEITDPGLIFDKEFPFIAGTPDGVFTRNGKKVSVQVKCPYNSQRHLSVFYGGAIDTVYWYQVQWEAMLLDADEIAFMTFDPRQPLATRSKVLDIPVCAKTRKIFRENACKFAAYVGESTRPADGVLKTESGMPQLF